MTEPTDAPTGLQEVRLNALRVGADPVIIIGRVVSAERREITRRTDGGKRPVLSGLLSDGTATVRFTWWDPPAEPIERGTVLRAGPVVATEYAGRVEVAFSWKTRVEPASESELPTVRTADLPAMTVGQLKARDDGFRLDGRVVRVRRKTVTVGTDEREIHEGVIADRTGAIAFTAWTDLGLRDGAAIRLSGAYVRAFRDRPQLVLDERSRIEPLDGAELPTAEAVLLGPERRLGELEAAGGAELATVAGVVVAVLPPSGLVYRCPQCRRSVTNGLCRVHGAVTGTPDLRSRVVVDDGTGSAALQLDRGTTETLWGRTLDVVLARLREVPDPSVQEEELFEHLFGVRLRATGRATVSEFGLTLYPETVTAEQAGAVPARAQAGPA